MGGIVEHQVGLEGFVGELKIAAVEAAQLGFDAVRQAREQHVAQQAAVRLVGGGVELFALEEAEAHAGGLLVARPGRGAGYAAHRVEHRQHAGDVVVRRGADARDERLGCGNGAIHFIHVASVAQVAEAPADRQADG